MKTSMLLALKGALLPILLSSMFQGGPVLATDGCGFAFVPAGTFSAGVIPQAAAAGDFNGDNSPDLVVANQFSGNVSVLLGNGNGTFQTAVQYGAGAGPVAVALADFDGDNEADLAVANSQSDNVSVRLGNGDGTFQTATNYVAGAGPSSVTVRDLNGDARLDLAVANRASGDVSVLLGNGDGTFQSPVSYLAGIDPLSVVAADFNDDSRTDLAVANAALFDVPPNISVLLGKQPNGTFQNAVNYEAGVSPRSVAAGDFNGDGRPDLAVANYGQIAGSTTTNSSVPVLLGAGDGTFSNAVHYLAAAGPLALAVADFNSDTNLDLVVANNRSNSLSVLPGNGNGTFQTAWHFNAGSRPRSVAVADFNADGKPDVAVVNDSGVLVLLNSCLDTAELAITMADTPDPVGAGNNLTYTLTVTNGGPNPVPDARLTDSLPAGLTFVSATTSQGSCTNNNGTIHCELGLLTNAAQATVTLIAATTVVGPVNNTAMVSSLATTDLNPGNNTATAVTTVLPELSIVATDPNASETGTDPGEFAVSRTGGTTGALTVNYTVAGTASNGDDYAMLGGAVTIPDGAASATLTVSPVDELAVEPVETVILTLSPSSGYVINPAADNATVSILDKDDHVLAIDDAVVGEGDTGTRSATFTVSLSPPNTQPVTVNFTTANGTAIAGADYVATNGVVDFPPGATNRSFEVTIIGDLLNETDEVFFVNLSDPANGVIADGQGMGSISNDDPVPGLFINDVTLNEGPSGSTNAVFTVQLSAVSGQTVIINFATANGTATAGGDYVATNGTLTFPPGTAAQSFAVEVNGDTLGELDEAFFVNLSDAVNATVSDSQGVATIINDDPPLAIGINDAAVVEGNSGTTSVVFTVTLSASNTLPVTVNYATANGSARWQDGDYERINNAQLLFAPGTTHQTVSVTVNGDTSIETNETFFVNLSSPVNATLAKSQGVGTILDDDGVLSLNLVLSTNALQVPEGGSNGFTIRLSTQPTNDLNVTISFASGDIDLRVANSANLLFTSSNGNLAQTVFLSAAEDEDAEDGQAQFTVSAPGLSSQTVTATEFDNDVSPPEITLGRLAGDDVLISFTTAVNRNYRLEHTEDFEGTPWTIAVNNIAGTGSVVTVTDVGGAGLTSRFYRVALVTAGPP